MSVQVKGVYIPYRNKKQEPHSQFNHLIYDICPAPLPNFCQGYLFVRLFTVMTSYKYRRVCVYYVCVLCVCVYYVCVCVCVCIMFVCVYVCMCVYYVCVCVCVYVCVLCVCVCVCIRVCSRL